MNANVHMSVGLATATGLALVTPEMQCSKPMDYAVCLGCALIGSIIPDIDANGESKAKKEFRKFMGCLLLISLVVTYLAYTSGNLSTLVGNLSTSRKFIGLVLFVVCCLIGYKSDHRKFTHWLIGLVCFTVPFIMMTNLRLGLWFGAGVLSHQLIDMLNKRKIQWLYPLPIDFARYICKASSTMSNVIGGVSIVLACVFSACLLF